MPSSRNQRIVVIGAGVLGLTTAVLLQDRFPHARITIVAFETPVTPPGQEAERPSPDYASMWAGAHFRPTPGAYFRPTDGVHFRPTSGVENQLADEQELALLTADKMRHLAHRYPESGVQTIVGREVMEYIPEDKVHFKTGDAYASRQGDEFRVLGPYELPPSAKWGCEYQTWVVNVHVYCRWLLAMFIRQGGNIVQRKLPKLDDAFEYFPPLSAPKIVVNCSGRNFDQDSKMNIIRGQTVLVKNAYHKTATRHNKDGSWSFLIPRPLGGGTIVGGTKQMGDWGTEIRPDETRFILAAAAQYWPEFVSKVEDFEILAINVGRRPWREGGTRIERQDFGDTKCVIHGYGVGARGYELSWGIAGRIVDLVGEAFDLTSKL